MRRGFAIVFLLLTSAPCFAQLGAQDGLVKSHQQVEQALPKSHPSSYYHYADRLFREGSKKEAVFWAYVGQIRYRFLLSTHPRSHEKDAALFNTLTETVGAKIDDWAGGDPDMWAKQIERALAWDAANANGSTSKSTYRKELEEVRALVDQTRGQISANRKQLLLRHKQLGRPTK